MDLLYEEEIRTKLKAARVILENESECSSADKVEQAKAQIELAEQTIALLETSARGSKRKSSQLRELVNELRKEAKELRMFAQNKLEEIERTKLLESKSRHGAGNDSGDDDEEKDLLSKKEQETLSRSGEALENSKRRVLEIEQVAIGITDSLDQSMATINSIKRKVQETTGLADTARSILKSMENMNSRKKMVVASSVFIVIFFAFILFFAWCDCVHLGGGSSAASTNGTASANPGR